MRVVIQKVKKASVVVGHELISEIGTGLLIFLGIESVDNQEDIQWLSRKIVNMRIFNDEEGKMNKSLLEVDGSVLVVSQFTLHASTKKGNRPSYIRSASPEIAEPLYEAFIEELNTHEIKEVKEGKFGANMAIELINDGPVTINMDSKNKE